MPWVGVICGYGNTLALKSDGSLWTWGHNNNGMLGLGDTTKRTWPQTVPPGGLFAWSAHAPRIAAGMFHSAINENPAGGRALVPGQQHNGQLGFGDTDQPRQPGLDRDREQLDGGGRRGLPHRGPQEERAGSGLRATTASANSVSVTPRSARARPTWALTMTGSRSLPAPTTPRLLRATAASGRGGITPTAS